MPQIFRKGQSVVEYTMLIIIVAAALMAMSTYIMRSVNARLKTAQDELSTQDEHEEE
ncbi:MAG: hypothetical protein WCY09_07520 [Candidatus Omnitrophota bacterium]